MLVVIDDKHQFDFNPERSFEQPEKVTKEWFTTWNLNGSELDICFNEDIFYPKTGTADDIDWKHIKDTIANFLSRQQVVLDKAHEALLALNKLLDAWTDETMALGYYDLVAINILRRGFELEYKLIGHTNEHYFIDTATAVWYVTFNTMYLQGVRRIVY